MNSPLALDGWLEWNRLKWGVTPHRRRVPVANAPPYVEAVFYTDRKGRFCLPNRNPYAPMEFASPARVASRLDRQWLECAGQVAAEMARCGVAIAIDLPPEIADLRPWRWAGFNVGLKYTLHLDFPYDLSHADKTLRGQVRKLAQQGYRVERTTNLPQVHQCLTETERRKGFDHELSLRDLELARDLLGDDNFRCYTCYTPAGEAASSCIALHLEGARALIWVGGSRDDHRLTGAHNYERTVIFHDLETAGAAGVDLAGANIPSVAAAKANFGARLVPYGTVEGYGVKPLARWVRGWWRFTERSRSRHAARETAPDPAEGAPVHR